MKKFWLAAVALVGLSGSMFADSIYGPSSTSGSFFTVGATSTFCCGAVTPNTGSNTQTPFWNNYSGDSINGDTNHTNVGDILAGSSTGTNLIGSNLSGAPSVLGTATTIGGQYFAVTSAAGGDPVTTNTGLAATAMTGATTSEPQLEFSFMSNATSYNIAVLFADSINDGGTAGGTTTDGGPATSVGTYILNSSVSCPVTQPFCVFTPVTTIDGAVQNNISGTPSSVGTSTLAGNGFVYGFYATVCYAWSSATTCTESVTYTSGDGNFSTGMSAGNQWLGGLGWNHFALFQLTSGEYVLGFEDSPWALGNSNATEGEGDFNDVVISLTSTAAPEPGTIGIMGLGLAAIGILGRRRFAKK